MPEEDMGYLMVNIQLPDAASLQRSNEVTKKVEEIIAGFDQVEYITAAAGFSLLSGSFSSNASFIFVSLKSWDQRDETALEIVDMMNVAFQTHINEAQVFAFRAARDTRSRQRLWFHDDASGQGRKYS